MSCIDEFFDQLRVNKYFSKIDFTLEYHQVWIREHHNSKTTFRTHFGYYKFLVMLFCLRNAPTLFKTLMDTMLHPYLGKFVVVFLDNILVYRNLCKEHKEYLCSMFELLRQHFLFAKERKCVLSGEKI